MMIMMTIMMINPPPPSFAGWYRLDNHNNDCNDLGSNVYWDAVYENDNNHDDANYYDEVLVKKILIGLKRHPHLHKGN